MLFISKLLLFVNSFKFYKVDESLKDNNYGMFSRLTTNNREYERISFKMGNMHSI